MKATTASATNPKFLKTDVPCLYWYSSNGVYYALIKQKGKQKKASLETTDKAVEKRNSEICSGIYRKQILPEVE